MEVSNNITSSLSKRIDFDGLQLSIEIYRLEHDSMWVLEVIDQNGTSTVWDDHFDSDQAALDEFMRTINEEGANCFRGNGNVVQFPKSST